MAAAHLARRRIALAPIELSAHAPQFRFEPAAFAAPLALFGADDAADVAPRIRMTNARR